MRGVGTLRIGHSGVVTIEQWYWCLEHNAVEPASGCRATERMGPYPTAEAAANWRETVAERNKKWDDEDEEWA